MSRHQGGTLGLLQLPQSLPIRTLLSLMGLALVLPALVGASFLVIRDARQERALIEQRLQQEASGLASSIDRELERLLALTELLSISTNLSNRNYAAFHERAVIATQRIGSNVIVIDPNDKMVANTRVTFGTLLPDQLSDPESITRVRTTLKPVVSNLFAGKVAKKFVFDVLIPITDGGAAGHILIMSLTTDYLLKLMGEQELPDGWSTGVVDRHGVIMARLIDHEQFVGKPLPSDLLLGSRTAGSVFETTNVLGEKILRSVAISKRAGWQISANVPLSLVNAGIRQSQYYVALMGLALLGGALALASYMARLIVWPIQSLAHAASALDREAEFMPFMSPVREANEIAGVLQSTSLELNSRLRRLLETEQRLNLAERTADLAHVDIDLVRCTITTSKSFADLFQFTLSDDLGVATDQYIAHVHEADREEMRTTIHTATTVVGSQSALYRIVRPDGVTRWIESRMETTGDEAGKPDRMLATTLDVTRRKEQEDHIQFLMDEVVHRSKNMLTIIQAMASQTARSSNSLNDFQSKFGRRLHGISLSLNLLVRQDWQGAELNSLIRSQLEPFIHDDVDRVVIDGVPIFLVPEATRALGLALHELATNALKYGALSVPAGKIHVSWTICGAAEAQMVRLEWRETGGPVAKTPTRKGFGSTVFERMIGESLGAKVATDYQSTGVVWILDGPLAKFSARGGGIARPLT